MAGEGVLVGCGECYGTLEVDSTADQSGTFTSWHTGAWCALDLSGLMSSAEKRGSDRIISQAAGVQAFPRRDHVTVATIPLIIGGAEDENGVAHPDPFQGLWDNLDQFIALFVDTPSTDTGTRTTRITLPGGSTKTGQAHVGRLRASVVKGLAVARATVPLTVVGGRLA